VWHYHRPREWFCPSFDNFRVADNSELPRGSSNRGANCSHFCGYRLRPIEGRTPGTFHGFIIGPLMPLGPSTRLGPYEIVAPLGVGGMGEVYRAKDTRLERTSDYLHALPLLPFTKIVD
jgi:serine/threonine protein kinase